MPGNSALAAEWGVDGLPPPVAEGDGKTRSADLKQLEKEWLTEPPASAPKFDTNNWTSTINAATGGAIEGVPVVGPYLHSGLMKLGARVRSSLHGTKYEDELKTVQDYVAQSAAAHPVASTTGNLTGAIGPIVAAGGIPAVAEGLGMTGPFAQRIIAGIASNAALGGADTAVRTGDLTEAAKGGVIGGLIGGAAPIAGRALTGGLNWAMRPAQDVSTQRLLHIAANEGIPISAAQASTSPFVKKLSQIAGQFPGSGAHGFQNEQAGGFTRAVSRTFGENTDNITPPVMRAAQTRIGDTMNTIMGRTDMVADLPLHQSFMNIARNASSTLTQDELRPIAHQMNQIADRFATNGRLTGAQYQALTAHDAPLTLMQKNGSANQRHFATEIRDSLDDLLQRNARPRDAAAFRDARLQYKNLMTVAPLVVKGTPGEISPLGLNQAVNRSFTNRAFRGAAGLGDLSEVGQRFFKQPADSGTPMGALIADQLMKHGNALAVGGLAAATGGGYLAGYQPEDILKGVGGLAAAGLLSRGATSVLNRPQTVNQLLSMAPYVSPYATGVARNQLAPAPP